jgi:hypothetical protein
MILPTDPPPVAVRAQLERQLQAVVGMLDDADLDALLDVAIARFVSPAPTPPRPDGVDLHQIEASLVARHGWVLGIVVRHATPLADRLALLGGRRFGRSTVRERRPRAHRGQDRWRLTAARPG